MLASTVMQSVHFPNEVPEKYLQVSSNPSNPTFLKIPKTQITLQVIEKHDQSKPLFMYLPFQSVHNPNEVPDSYYQVSACAGQHVTCYQLVCRNMCCNL